MFASTGKERVRCIGCVRDWSSRMLYIHKAMRSESLENVVWCDINIQLAEHMLYIIYIFSESVE